MIRTVDFTIAILGLIFLLPVLFFLFVIGSLDTGSPLFIQTRIGKNQIPFKLVKFRTMKKQASSMGTHLIDPSVITSYGKILRATKLDELPQLWNVLVGDMSLVGPRPNLPNQTELIKERALRNVYLRRPGITGLAQIRKIDMSTPELLALTDAQMLEKFNISQYFSILFTTISGKGFGDRVKR